METKDINKKLDQIEIILSDFIHIFPILMEIYIKIKMNKVFEEKKNLVLLENLIELSKKSKILLEDQDSERELRVKPLFDVKSIWQDKKREEMLIILERSMNFFPTAMQFKKKNLENEPTLTEEQYYNLLKKMVSIGEETHISQRRDLKFQDSVSYNLFGQVQRPDQKTKILKARLELGERILSVENADIQEESGNIFITIPKFIVHNKDSTQPFYEEDYDYSVFVLKSKKNDKDKDN